MAFVFSTVVATAISACLAPVDDDMVEDGVIDGGGNELQSSECKVPEPGLLQGAANQQSTLWQGVHTLTILENGIHPCQGAGDLRWDYAVVNQATEPVRVLIDETGESAKIVMDVRLDPGDRSVFAFDRIGNYTFTASRSDGTQVADMTMLVTEFRHHQDRTLYQMWYEDGRLYPPNTLGDVNWDYLLDTSRSGPDNLRIAKVNDTGEDTNATVLDLSGHDSWRIDFPTPGRYVMYDPTEEGNASRFFFEVTAQIHVGPGWPIIEVGAGGLTPERVVGELDSTFVFFNRDEISHTLRVVPGQDLDGEIVLEAQLGPRENATYRFDSPGNYTVYDPAADPEGHKAATLRVQRYFLHPAESMDADASS